MSKYNKKKLWKNGGRKSHETEANDEKSINQNKAEEPGTLEDSSIPELTMTTGGESESGKQPNFKRKSRFKAFKPFLVAALSAVVIGSVLGFFMLNMFVDINENISTQGNASSLAAAEEEGSGEANNSLAKIASSNAFVLQAGKFSEKENAEQMQETFAQQSFPSMIWEKGKYFYVLAGLAGSAEKGNQLSKGFTEQGLEVYVTEWETASQEMELTETEKDWLQSYEEQWGISMASINDNNTISQEEWTDIVENMPEESELLSGFTNFLTDQYQQMEEAGEWESQIILLKLWERTSELGVQ